MKIILILFSFFMTGCLFPSVKEGLNNGSLSIEKDGSLTNNKGGYNADSKKKWAQETSKKSSKKVQENKKSKKISQEIAKKNDNGGDDKSPHNHSSCKDTILPPPNFDDSRECTEKEAQVFDCWCSLNPLEKRLRLFIKEKTDNLKRGEL